MAQTPRQPNAPTPPPPPPRGHDSLMRNLGEFFGHVVEAIKTDPTKPAAQEPASQPPAGPVAAPAPDAQPALAAPTKVVREDVQERLHVAPGGEKYVLRRRVIDEVEILPGPALDGPP